MKMIVISEEAWNALWESTLRELDRGKLDARVTAGNAGIDCERLHRAFHYEVVSLKQKIERT